MYSAMIQPYSLTVVFMDDGTSHTITPDNPAYQKAVDLIKAKADAPTLRAELDAIARLKAQVGAVTKHGDIEVTRDGITYKGREIAGTIVTRVREHIAEGFPVEPLLNFLDKLLRNPRASAVASLYDFLETNSVTITPDGDFLAYKKVREDFRDIHSGKYDNSPGQTPSMLPWEVDENRDNHCSSGLHVCSDKYLPHFGSGPGNKVVLVKVNPEWVVAVPRDYNFAKMRLFKYSVLADVTSKFKPEEIHGVRVGTVAPDGTVLPVHSYDEDEDLAVDDYDYDYEAYDEAVEDAAAFKRPADPDDGAYMEVYHDNYDEDLAVEAGYKAGAEHRRAGAAYANVSAMSTDYVTAYHRGYFDL